jgi:hypothetical protein
MSHEGKGLPSCDIEFLSSCFCKVWLWLYKQKPGRQITFNKVKSFGCDRSFWGIEICTFIIFNIWIIRVFRCFRIKSRKEPIIFVISVRLFFRINQSDSHWTDFHEILYWLLLRKYLEKFQIWLKSDTILGNLHEDLRTFILRQHYEIFCSLSTMQREPIAAFP